MAAVRPWLWCTEFALGCSWSFDACRCRLERSRIWHFWTIFGPFLDQFKADPGLWRALFWFESILYIYISINSIVFANMSLEHCADSTLSHSLPILWWFELKYAICFVGNLCEALLFWFWCWMHSVISSSLSLQSLRTHHVHSKRHKFQCSASQTAASVAGDSFSDKMQLYLNLCIMLIFPLNFICFHFGGISKPSIFAEERLQVFDLGGVLGHLPGPWGRSLRLVPFRGGWPNVSLFRRCSRAKCCI